MLCGDVFLYSFFFLMIRRPPRSTRTDTLFPYTTLFRDTGSQLAEVDHRVPVVHGVSAGETDPCRGQDIDPQDELCAAERAEAAVLRLDRHILGKNARILHVVGVGDELVQQGARPVRSEKHTYELQSLMSTLYA